MMPHASDADLKEMGYGRRRRRRSTGRRSTGRRSTGRRSTGRRSTGRRSTGRRRQDGARRLRTYADRPVEDPALDAFGYLPYADAFSLLINDRHTATPLTVAISGPWGCGKTSLAKLLEERLRVQQYWLLGWDKAPITCWFNAWMHSDAQDLGSALAASVTRDVSGQRPLFWRIFSPLPSVMLSPEGRAWRRVWIGVVTASLALLTFMGLLWLLPELRPTSGKLGKLFGHWQLVTLYAAAPAAIGLLRRAFKVSDSVGTFIDAPRSAAAQGNLAEVYDQLGRIMRQAQRRWRGKKRPTIPPRPHPAVPFYDSAVGIITRFRARAQRLRVRAQRRVVIFVDDLERCPAEKALDMCEVVSLLLGHEDVVTILVADLNLLESAADARYRPADADSPQSDDVSSIGQEYLQKMIQLRFNLPPLDRDIVASSLGLANQPDSTDRVSTA